MKDEMGISVLDILEAAFCEAATTREPMLVAKRDGFQFAYEYVRDLSLTPEQVRERMILAGIALEHGLAMLLLFIEDGKEEEFMKGFMKKVLGETRMMNQVIPMVKLLGAERAIDLIRERGKIERGPGR